ncbi:(2Fe-2S)-binding protein [Myxococcota bacterium]|nr:(2Fe-2S)-binding protein [Myxococcota bacterium]
MPRDLVLSTTVNGEPVRLLIPAHRSLLDLLREDLGLTGSKHGCDVGDCGACTVHLDGQPRLACITLAAEVQGRRVTTIEGMAPGGVLHPVQDALHRHVGAQCGYCTPGIVMSLSALMQERQGEEIDDAALKEALGANICRCTGYTKILAAAHDAIKSGERQTGRAAGREA